jgi:hypothetical protein
MTPTPGQPTPDAERLADIEERQLYKSEPSDIPQLESDIAYLLAALARLQQERDEWKRRSEDAEGRIANALA